MGLVHLQAAHVSRGDSCGATAGTAAPLRFLRRRATCSRADRWPMLQGNHDEQASLFTSMLRVSQAPQELLGEV